jgi:asparagine synthase (glutamine-hydrolysing)
MIGAYLFWDRSPPGPKRMQAFGGAVHAVGAQGRTFVFGGAILCDGVQGASAHVLRLQDGRAVVFDGFIANRRTLRAELAVRHDLSDASDARLYAAARDQWGTDADLRVIGEYAAILIPQDAGPIEVVRSPIAGPAVYLWHDTERLIVSTSVQALFATGEVARVVDEQKLADTLLLNYNEERRSWFNGVLRLPRGTRAQVTPDGLAEQAFFRIEDIAPVRFARDRDYVEAADALMREAVSDMLDGFERPSVSLSGGLDSQAVAAYAMALHPERPLLSGTSVPQSGWIAPDPDKMTDESGHVRALAQMYPQLQTQWIPSVGRDFSHFQRELFAQAMVAPRNGANLYWIHDLHQSMRAAGADVVLTGSMGNLTFSYDGTGAVPDLLRNSEFRAFFQEVWGGGPRLRVLQRLGRDGVIPFLPHNVRLAFYRWRIGRSRNPLETWSPLHPDYAQRQEVFARARALGMDIDYLPAVSMFAYRKAMLHQAANEMGDIGPAMERLHDLPMRDPTSHRRLLEFCFAIPGTQYVNLGRKRWLARRMLAGKVPPMVLREQRRGRQGADWFDRLLPARDSLIDELDWLSHDPDVAGRLDLARLRKALSEMPAEENALDAAQTATLRLALSRGLTTARFIRFLNGRNDF